jgi:ABC-2 type transport system ATP-binding protein
VPEGDDGLAVAVTDTAVVGDLAHSAGIGVIELTRRTASLEEAFLELTSADQQYATGTGSGDAA